MGAVYEARHERLDRRVAIKTLHPEYALNQETVARFFNEAKVLSKLEHPSIVQVSDFGHTKDGAAYLVMEYLRGESLASRLRKLIERHERLSLSAALQFALQVADVLAIAHAQGIIHRDLKPDNLMLVSDPVAPGGERVKILDFGIAKLIKEKDRGGVKTDTQAVMGTPMYMSPEQCAGAGGVDAKTDVYSLGCVLYEVFAGRPPFVAEGAGQLIGMHLFQTPPPLSTFVPKIPHSIAELVHRLLTRNKVQRPSMVEACDEISRILSSLPGGQATARSQLPVNTDPDATRAVQMVPASSTLGQSIGQKGFFPRQRRRLLIVGIGSLVLLVSLLVIILRNGHQSVPLGRPVQSPFVPSSSVGSHKAAAPPASVASPPPITLTPPGIQRSETKPKPASPPTKIFNKPSTSKPLRPDSNTTPLNHPKVLKSKGFGYED